MNDKCFKRYILIKNNRDKFTIINRVNGTGCFYHDLRDIVKIDSSRFIINYTGKFIDKEIEQGLLIIEFEFDTLEELRKEYMEYFV